MTLSTMKQRIEEALRNFLTRFNDVTTQVGRPDLSVVLMAVGSGVTNKIDFKVVLKRNPPMDLAKFYHETERFFTARGCRR